VQEALVVWVATAGGELRTKFIDAEAADIAAIFEGFHVDVFAERTGRL
jgi:hypothetical protein